MSKLKNRRDARQATDNSLYQNRKQQIREAAAKVFLEKGFAATKLSDVAKEAKMDRASLYYYVSSKQDLFEDMFSSGIESNVKTAEEIANSDRCTTDKIAEMIEMLMVSFETGYPYFYIFVQEDLKKIESLGDERNDKWLKSASNLSRQYFQTMSQIVSEGIESGEITTSLPSRLVTHSIIGMVNSSARWFRPNDIMSAKEIGKGMAKMVIGGLKV